MIMMIMIIIIIIIIIIIQHRLIPKWSSDSNPTQTGL